MSELSFSEFETSIKAVLDQFTQDHGDLVFDFRFEYGQDPLSPISHITEQSRSGHEALLFVDLFTALRPYVTGFLSKLDTINPLRPTCPSTPPDIDSRSPHIRIRRKPDNIGAETRTSVSFSIGENRLSSSGGMTPGAWLDFIAPVVSEIQSRRSASSPRWLVRAAGDNSKTHFLLWVVRAAKAQDAIDLSLAFLAPEWLYRSLKGALSGQAPSSQAQLLVSVHPEDVGRDHWLQRMEQLSQLQPVPLDP